MSMLRFYSTFNGFLIIIGTITAFAHAEKKTANRLSKNASEAQLLHDRYTNCKEKSKQNTL